MSGGPEKAMRLKIFALAFGAALAFSAVGTALASPPSPTVCTPVQFKGGAAITVPAGAAAALQASGQWHCGL